MKQLLAGICCAVLLWPVLSHAAGGIDVPLHRVGVLSCDVLPHSGINLLIHSTRDIRCTFSPAADGSTEYYKGETGVGFGIDMAFDKSSTLDFSVLAKHFAAGTRQLAGKYSGAGGNASLGLTVGETAPIRKNDGSISLQPVGGKNKGAGVSAGFTYLHLEKASK